MRISVPTWDWSYDNQAGWTLDAGDPHIEERRYRSGGLLRPRNPTRRARIGGAYSLHVFCAQWHIEQKRKRVVSSRSDATNIRRWFARLDGIWLRTLTFHRQGWVRAATFEEGYRLVVVPYAFARDDPDCIANWLTWDPDDPASRAVDGRG